ncbi:MAG: hypothetical protein CMP23_15765 [Rickettsiales bacterium]|nr:hypothetical protein [Rickettsiales bacterium]
MARHAAGFEGLGASLMAVGCGSVQMAQSFQRELDVQIPLYTDPSRRSYALLGFKRKVLIFGPKIFNRGRRAWSAGFRQGPVAGDAWQQGGELVAVPGDQLLYVRPSNGPGDHAPVDALKEVLVSFNQGTPQ